MFDSSFLTAMLINVAVLNLLYHNPALLVIYEVPLNIWAASVVTIVLIPIMKKIWGLR